MAKKAENIVTWLNSLEEVKTILAEKFEGRPINDGNLSEWKLGGFRDWQERQSALAEARRVMAEGLELAETGNKALADNLAAWMLGRYVVATRKLLENGADAEGWKLTREICHDLVALRRGDHGAEWLRIEQERLKMERQKNARERKKARSESDKNAALPALSEEEKERQFDEIFGSLQTQTQPQPQPQPELQP